MKNALTDDLDLIKGCLANDRNSQRILYNKYAPKMLAVCMRYSTSKDEAEDVMIEGFMKVFTSLESFAYKSSLEVWIRSIMTHCAINSYRKNQKFRFAETIEEMAEEPDAQAWNSIPDSISEKEILLAIQKMPPYLQAVLNLIAFDGYSYEEVSQELEISQVTVRTRLFRAKKWLLDYIDSEH